MTSSLPLSVVYITLNAERLLLRSLMSVQRIAGEILIVDAGSADATVEIGKQVGARIIERPWSGFGAQRQFSVESARHDWVLVMDADEVLRDSAALSITHLLQNPQGKVAFRLRRRSFLQNRPVRFGDWNHDWVLRFMDRRQGNYNSVAVHESWQTTGPVGRIKGTSIDHYSYENYLALVEKMQSYAALSALQIHHRGKKVRHYMPMAHALAAFSRSYAWRLGFLDGVNGAAIAWTTALGAFMKYAVALELQEQAAKEGER